MSDPWASVALLCAVLALCAVLVAVAWLTDPERKDDS